MNEYKYDNKLNEIIAVYDIHSPNPFLRFEDFSFDLTKLHQTSGKLFYMKGIIAHYSTLDSFNKLSNYKELIKYAEDRASISSFILLIYGDLKNYTFTYSLVEINNDLEYKLKKITSIDKLEEDKKTLLTEFYSSHISGDVLKYYSSPIFGDQDKYIFLHDISSITTNIPSFLKIAIKEQLNNKIISANSNLFVVLIKDYSNLLANSVLLTIDQINITLNGISFDIKNLKILTSDLKQMFDPYSIAENAVDLNINLMKWKMAPDIDIKIIKEKKFLLIGSGTLGCHVSRNLLGWGARNINFLDCGKVSYSNPVRQSLFNFKDSSEGDNFKSLIAAKKLKEIFPMVNSEGYNLLIPLPSRVLVNSSVEENYFNTVQELEKIISEHDIIFLLTDSRESRWFPTMISKSLNKTVITAAIGFDSFLVMRHGNDENSLGCYFCNDIISPVDTSINRTLDQQCTISRPGISSICSGFACEIAISLLQKGNSLGSYIPQSIRGNLTDYNFLCIDHSVFSNCVACSSNVINQFRTNRNEFLINIMNDPDYIEYICGVEKLIKDINLEDIDIEDDF